MSLSRKSLAATISATALLFALLVQADELHDDLMADMPALMELYRDLHANPELTFEEHELPPNWLCGCARWASRLPRASA